MTRNRFLILNAIGVIGIFVLIALDVEYQGGWTFIYFCIICEWRRLWLNKPWGYWMDLRNILEQFKKP
jgi:hypothetical protein